jgi:hypothetical protein
VTDKPNDPQERSLNAAADRSPSTQAVSEGESDSHVHAREGQNPSIELLSDSTPANARPDEIVEKTAPAESSETEVHESQGPKVQGAKTVSNEQVASHATTDVEPTPRDEELPSRPSPEELDQEILADSRRHTRRSFIVAAAAAAAGYGLYNWIEERPAEEMQPAGFRRAFEANASVSRKIFDDRALSPTYPLSKAEDLRVNGVYGLKMLLSPESYRLQVVGGKAAPNHPRYSQDVTAWEYVYVEARSAEDQGHDTKTPPPSAKTAEKMAPESMVEQEKQKQERSGRMPRGREEAGRSRSTLPGATPGLLLTMEDVLKLPRYELITQFKCIEGWSQIVHWAGVRMADFLEAYPPAPINGKEPRFVYMETPDGDYYTGYDMHVCRHPQTLLVTEMMGVPLTQFHGAPLRLHMPTKYGYKQIKRIGLISYTNNQPDDYWTKLGYDWYAGL